MHSIGLRTTRWSRCVCVGLGLIGLMTAGGANAAARRPVAVAPPTGFAIDQPGALPMLPRQEVAWRLALELRDRHQALLRAAQESD
jgi:hypothetical protein